MRRPREERCGAAKFYRGSLYQMPTYVPLVPGARHWQFFRRLATDARASGNDVTDAYLAAFALEHDATFVSFDRGFARFPGLKVFVPGGA